jgi:hypothetical protein
MVVVAPDASPPESLGPPLELPEPPEELPEPLPEPPEEPLPEPLEPSADAPASGVADDELLLQAKRTVEASEATARELRTREGNFIGAAT